MKLSNTLKTYLTNYNSNKINTLDMYIGHYIIKNKNNIVFNKNISKENYNKYLNKYLLYKNISYNQSIYRDNNNYLYINNNREHYFKTNFKNFNLDNVLLVSYNKQCKSYSEFPCKKTYNIIKNKIIKFIINDEISILFIEENEILNIKIEIDINHNIDLSIKFLENLEL